MTRYALVAGEDSGDALGAGLVRALRESEPDADFLGVAGPRMTAAGCRRLASVADLGVMGLAEVLGHLPRLLKLRRRLAEELIAARPDCVIGIDAPDFNLGLESRLKAAGIPVIHYVSPSVWAWRAGRVKAVSRACDKVLCLFPFEPSYYRNTGVHAEFVGHPLADAIPVEVDRAAARQALGFRDARCVVALLPGSRASEAGRLAGPFAAAAKLMLARRPGTEFIAPIAGERPGAIFREAVAREGLESAVRLVDGRAHEVMAASDVALIASGTATLEALLLGCPMVVAYRVAPLTHLMLKRTGLLRIRRYALPNILAGRSLVPELMQGEVTAEALAAAALAWLEEPERVRAYRRECRRFHDELRQGADQRAAASVRALVRGRTRSGVRREAG